MIAQTNVLGKEVVYLVKHNTSGVTPYGYRNEKSRVQEFNIKMIVIIIIYNNNQSLYQTV